ncbi:MAG: fibronectin type III domain-containing protein [Verrucomicrobiota bacterium]
MPRPPTPSLRCLLPLFALPFACPLLAHQGHETDGWKPTLYADKLAHAPRPLPDRVVLTWSGDPAATQSVTWRTDTSVVRALAELAVANDNGRELKPRPVPARTQHLTSDISEAAYHSVTFADLTPDTLYTYRVGDGANWSEWFHFRTASREARPFTFIYFGDAQNDIKMHWSRVFRESFRDAPRAAFTLHAGDLINNANRDAQWGEWFGAPAWVNATVPVVATPGNHEHFADGAGPETERKWTTKDGSTLEVSLTTTVERDAAGKAVRTKVLAKTADGRSGTITLGDDDLITGIDEGVARLTGYAAADLVGQQADKRPLRDRLAVPGVRTVSRHWRPSFTLPEQGAPASLEETCYFIDYQGARIISLDSNRLQKEQIPWLRAALESNRQRWTILTFHHPIFSPANNRDNPELRAAWKPIFDEFKVDLVLTGHDHSYARSGDTRGRGGSINIPEGYNQAYDPAVGTVYVVSVSGPKMYNVTTDFAVRSAEDTQLYQIIHVGLEDIRYEARTATGRLYDAFTLKKRTGQANELIETLPLERRRKPIVPKASD